MNKHSIMGGILAGGLSRRMGGQDKALISLENQPLISHVANRLINQVDSIVVNANGDPKNYVDISYPLVCDIIEGYAGPLAGIHALINYAKTLDPKYTHVATVAADTPFFPDDFVDRCIQALEDGQPPASTIILAKSNQNRHPVFGLWPLSLSDSLEQFLTTADTRKVMAFVQMHSFQYAEFPLYELDEITVDPFFNINSPDDLLEAASVFKQLLSPQQHLKGNHDR